MTALPDRQDRIAATTVFDRNIVVLAGAGTGKTSLLVERVLNLVGSGFCELEHLAAITFTEKAAAELRLQIAAGLEQLRAAAAGERDADPGEPSGRSFTWLTGDRKFEGKLLAERALAALQQMDRARLLTIHAFCAELLRAFPVEARVDPDFRVDTGEQAALLCRAHWDRFVEAELGPDGKRHGLWNRTLGAFGLGELAEAARVLSGWNFPLELLAPERARGGAALLAEQAAQVVVEIDRLEERAGGITPGQTSWFATVRRCLTALAAGDEAEFARLLDDPAVRRQLAHDRWLPGKKLTGVSKAEFLRVADHARQLSRLLSRLDDGRFGDLVETLAPFVVSFREEFSRRGFVSFDGLLALTRDLLRDHPKVRERLKRRFDTLLVDEF
ncbi:MAG: UvrD-helicase domain-containing protein, partial [Acidobacteriota bacterium]